MENSGYESEVYGIAEDDGKITPWYLLSLIKPVLADELVAKLRFDRSGIKIAFCNGQKFHLKIEEM